METKKVLNLALSLMIGGSLLAGCGPAKTPGTVANNKPGATASSKPGATASSKPTTPTTGSNTSESQESAANLSAELQAVVADDATTSDSAKADSGFSTAMLESDLLGGPIAGPGQVTATAVLNPGTVLTPRRVDAATRTRLEGRRKAGMALALKSKSILMKSDALTVNADGTITVDPAKIRAYVKAQVEARAAKLKAFYDANKDKLKAGKAAAKEQIAKMRRRNNVVRTSDVVSTTNADGSVTKTITVEFKNEKTGVMRNVVASRTHKDGKLVSADYLLTVTGPNGFSRTVHRSMTTNEDGSRTWTTQAKTTWGDGRTSERNETRTVNPGDNSAVGGGTVAVTEGSETEDYDYEVVVDAEGNETVSGDEDADSEAVSDEEEVEVVVEDTTADETPADGDEVTVAVTVDENPDDTTPPVETVVEVAVDEDADANAEAGAEAGADAGAAA